MKNPRHLRLSLPILALSTVSLKKLSLFGLVVQ
jgi:hypothetical protein